MPFAWCAAKIKPSPFACGVVYGKTQPGAVCGTKSISNFGNFIKWVSAKLKFDLTLRKTTLFYDVVFLRKVKSHDMKIVDDVSAGPSLNMTVKSVYNTFT